MIDAFVGLAEEKLKELCWIESFGGLAKIAYRHYCNENGLIKVQQFPVVCNTKNEDCFNNTAYKILAPDSSKKSVLYFLQNGTLNTEKIFPTGRRTMKKSSWSKKTVNLKLLGWLNMKAIGFEGCDLSSAIFPDLENIFNCACPIPEGFIYPRHAVKEVRFNIRSFDPFNVTLKTFFGQYTYGEEYKLYFYPYMIFSLNIELSFKINTKCIPKIKCAEPIICTNVAKVANNASQLITA